MQVNHPREGSAYFNASGYDPVVGPVDVDADFWPGTFESVEVVNDEPRVRGHARLVLAAVAGIRHRRCRQLRHARLRRSGGLAAELHGVSHRRPRRADDDIILDAITDLAVSVSGGVFLDFPDGELPGDTVQPEEGQPFSIRVRAQTPEWARADVLVTYVDGIEVARQVIGDGADPAIIDRHESSPR